VGDLARSVRKGIFNRRTQAKAGTDFLRLHADHKEPVGQLAEEFRCIQELPGITFVGGGAVNRSNGAQLGQGEAMNRTGSRSRGERV
jgi:hypothetical protein